MCIHSHIYRFVDIHYRLVPYLLTTGSHALENGKSSITPLADHSNFIEKVPTMYDVWYRYTCTIDKPNRLANLFHTQAMRYYMIDTVCIVQCCHLII